MQYNTFLTINTAFLVLNVILAFLLVIKILHNYYIQKHFHNYYRDLLRKAEEETTQIIHTTNKQAQQLINSVQNDSKQHKKYLESSFKQVTDRQNQLINNLLTQMHHDYFKFTKDIREQLAQSANNINRILLQQGNREIAEFAHSLKKNTILSEKSFQKKLNSELTQAKKEIETYKQHKLKQLDKRIFEIISDTTKTVLPDLISPTEHAKLIIKALEQAKKNNSPEDISTKTSTT